MEDCVLPDMRFLETAHSILDTIFERDEPMPAWERGDRAILENFCRCTEVGTDDDEKYPDLASKAAKLFYSIIKNHPFPNGNKRFAFVVTLGFLVLNDHRLTAPEGLGYDVAEWVAEQDPRLPDGKPDLVVEALGSFFRDHMEPYDWNRWLEENREDDPPATG